MELKRICSWCKKDINPEVKRYNPEHITHGICSECLETIQKEVETIRKSHPILISSDTTFKLQS